MKRKVSGKPGQWPPPRGLDWVCAGGHRRNGRGWCVGHHRGADRAAVVLPIGIGLIPVTSSPVMRVPSRARQQGYSPGRAGTWQKPRPAGRFPPPYAGPVVWIRTIDSRGSIDILFEFVEPGGYRQEVLPGEFSGHCDEVAHKRVFGSIFTVKHGLQIDPCITVQSNTDIPRGPVTQPGRGPRGTRRIRHRCSWSRALCPKYLPEGRGLPAQTASQYHRSSPSPPLPT